MTAGKIIIALIFGLLSFGAAFTIGIESDNMAFALLMAAIAGAATVFVALKAPSGKQALVRGGLGFGMTLVVMSRFW
jgi:hypothetical protein